MSISLPQQHYQDLFPAKVPLSREILAQASLGLLLFERQEQERRASLSNGEDSQFTIAREGNNCYLLDLNIKSGFLFRVDILLMNHFPSVYAITYLGHVIFYYFAGCD